MFDEIEYLFWLSSIGGFKGTVSHQQVSPGYFFLGSNIGKDLSKDMAHNTLI